MRIDAHVHLPVNNTCTMFAEKKDYLLRAMEQYQLERCIVISDSCSDSPIGSMEECVSLFAKESSRVSVVGGISPLVESAAQLAKMELYLEQKSLIGIKLFPGHEAFYLTDQRLEPIYRLALQYHVPVLFHSGGAYNPYSSVNEVKAVLDRYPEMKLVCCHCFYPNLALCRSLSSYPNLYFDISSVADNQRSLETIKQEIKALMTLAPDRVLFGSDAFGCSMGAHISLVKGLQLLPDQEERLFAQNAVELYGL